MVYELYYWPIQGRGEFARLVLEDAGADWVDVTRERDGMKKMQAILGGSARELLPFAPPFLHDGDVWLAQSAQIASYLGEQLGLAPADEPPRHVARTIMLTIADLVAEVHDTHHPIAVDKYYDEQKAPAKLRATSFRDKRMPKFLGWLERILEREGTGWLVGDRATYVDLAAFQILEGLGYAFPRALAQLRPKIARLVELHDRVAQRPNIAAYLASDRRYAFDEHGIFRRYPELDAPSSRSRSSSAAKQPASKPKARAAKRRAAPAKTRGARSKRRRSS